MRAPSAGEGSLLTRVADSDEDGIVDGQDACPKAAECINGFDDEDGCPDETPPEVLALAGELETVVFAYDKGHIKPGSFAELDLVVETLKAWPQVRIEVQNHRAADGQDVYGRDITRVRAHVVADYLIDHGVDPQQIEARGYGEERPIDTNSTPEGRANNRRTELRLLAPYAMLVDGGCAPRQD